MAAGDPSRWGGSLMERVLERPMRRVDAPFAERAEEPLWERMARVAELAVLRQALREPWTAIQTRETRCERLRRPEDSGWR